MSNQFDLDEVAPNRFLFRSSRLTQVLKSEGRIEGHMFVLTGWRRDGLMARLRADGFTVSTLADQITALPVRPSPPDVGPARPRLLMRNDRYSRFDTPYTGWVPIVPVAAEGSPPSVMLPLGLPVRKRQGRGPTSFYRVVREGTGSGLAPMGENTALLLAYAHLAATEPFSVTLQATAQGVVLPQIELPAPYRVFMRRLATESAEGWLADADSALVVCAVYARLGVVVQKG